MDPWDLFTRMAGNFVLGPAVLLMLLGWIGGRSRDGGRGLMLLAVSLYFHAL